MNIRSQKMKTIKIIIISLTLIGLCNRSYAGDSTDTPTPRYRSGGNVMD